MSRDINLLGAQFPFNEVKAKIQVTNKDKSKGMVVFYVDSRAIHKRLDDAVGMYNWSNHFTAWKDNAQICGISIYDNERNEWVTKYDGAKDSDIEAVKGGLSDAFKRAAVLWGIGRYLYQIDGVWVEIEQRGNSSYIKDDQWGKIRATYEAAVNRIFAVAASKPSDSTEAKQKQTGTKAQSVQTKPQASPQPKSPQSAITTGTTTEQDNSADGVIPIDAYRVHNMKAAGQSSQLLELCSHYGELKTAYIKNGAEGIAIGTNLKNVRFEEKSNSFGKFNLIAGYEVAA